MDLTGKRDVEVSAESGQTEAESIIEGTVTDDLTVEADVFLMKRVTQEERGILGGERLLFGRHDRSVLWPS